jgi:uncharacterized cysteine cluster protein YcgN (CxxCxxCC family)
MKRFWQGQTLDRLSIDEWEALCDGCGRCCLEKLKYPTTGKIFYTRVACQLLDIHACRCAQYELRRVLVPDCAELRPEKIARMRWLPKTCAYRLVAAGKELPEWHPLVSGSADSVHAAGISVRGWAVSAQSVYPDDLDKYILKQRL